MKYMGSKRELLKNGLGQLLLDKASSFERFVDLFCGAGSVSWYVAERSSLPVHAIDLQDYARILTAAVIERTSALNGEVIERKWIKRARKAQVSNELWKPALKTEQQTLSTTKWCKEARSVRSRLEGKLSDIVWRCYGGHYFSLCQATAFDALLKCLPTDIRERSVCHAALIMAASMCSASPGHTAQPFQPTRTASRYLREAWCRDPWHYVGKALKELCNRHALKAGKAKVGDAVQFAKRTNEHDLVFIDPPYSGVHYSRFYHVLETIARSKMTEVSGTGRYPPPKDRPASSFSRRSESGPALASLLQSLAKSRATVIFTFPMTMCSNGLSGTDIIGYAKKLFRVKDTSVASTFSTLGGNGEHRDARNYRKELVLFMRPK